MDRLTPPEPGQPVGSPCHNVCRIDPATGWCLGCRRSIDEIAAWSALDDAVRRRIWLQLPRRVPPTPDARPGDPR